MASTTEDRVVLQQTLMTVDEVFVYRVPPLRTSGGHRYVLLLLSLMLTLAHTPPERY